MDSFGVLRSRGGSINNSLADSSISRESPPAASNYSATASHANPATIRAPLSHVQYPDLALFTR